MAKIVGDGLGSGCPVSTSRNLVRPAGLNSAPASKSKFMYDCAGINKTVVLPFSFSSTAFLTKAVGPSVFPSVLRNGGLQ